MLLHKSVVQDSRVRREAATLAEEGHDVVVLELAPVEQERLDGFRRVSVLPPARLRRLPFHLHRAMLAWTFARGVVRERPDVIHAHDAAMLVPGLLGARITGARLVYDTHELATGVPYRETFWAWFVDRIERLGLPRTAAVITVSDGIAARLVQRYSLPVTPVVLRNVCDLQLTGTGALRERSGVPAGTPLILHQGAPALGRGCDVLVRAMAHVPDAHLVFLGDADPPIRRQLDALVAETGLNDRVHFVASVPLAELLAHTAEADVGVTLLQDTCENHRLALPNKLFEYLAAGVPVVASALPELSGIVHARGVGATVDQDDPVAVAAGIAHVIAARAADAGLL
ncbi:MAG: glycosyl transferase group 1, partial [Solirubrobacterales bacterium]|nr:glycosyl transferase group 1 [Solirubrobacterales bacterium]